MTKKEFISLTKQIDDMFELESMHYDTLTEHADKMNSIGARQGLLAAKTVIVKLYFSEENKAERMKSIDEEIKAANND